MHQNVTVQDFRAVGGLSNLGPFLTYKGCYEYTLSR